MDRDETTATAKYDVVWLGGGSSANQPLFKASLAPIVAVEAIIDKQSQGALRSSQYNGGRVVD